MHFSRYFAAFMLRKISSGVFQGIDLICIKVILFPRRIILPWVKKEDCISCGICIEACSVDAIHLVEEKAEINLNTCIRCGICHTACPQEAVRHDSELIPGEVEDNIEWTMNLLTHYTTNEDKKGFMNRIEKHFMKDKTVAEKTLEKLKDIKV